MRSRKRKTPEAPTPDRQSPPQTSSEGKERASDEPVRESDTCDHEYSCPQHWKPVAKEFPFPFAAFQSEAIKWIARGETVMVSAPASAGKTTIAAYAVAMSLRDQRKIIYVSPVKSLCIQEYKKFKCEFQNVGLMMGDVAINPEASCVVMTPETLRSMLHKRSNLVREASYLVFDDVHTISSRVGVVLEESIILAPSGARYVFLSTRVANAKQFADWFTEVHQQPCHIISTDNQPAPLKHYVVPSLGSSPYLIVDENGKFLEDNFQGAWNVHEKNMKEVQEKSYLESIRLQDKCTTKLVKAIINDGQHPVIIFCSSKRECNILTDQMMTIDLYENVAKDEAVRTMNTIKKHCRTVLDILSDDDKGLHQVSTIRGLLKRGIGVYHSGLLPILRHLIERSFEKGFIKCLFSTENFGMGLNVSAKTVLFRSLSKFDGNEYRLMSSGEYIQMCGRALRRGQNECVNCIVMLDDKVEPSTAKMIALGSADRLKSSFHLSYNMLLKYRGGKLENLLGGSFYWFQAVRFIPDLQRQSKDLQAEIDSITIGEEASLKKHYELLQLYRSLKRCFRDMVFSPQCCIPYLQCGRLVSVRCTIYDEKPSFSTEDHVTWGVITDPGRLESIDGEYEVEVFLKCIISKEKGVKKKIVQLNDAGEPAFVVLPLSEICNMSCIRMRMPERDNLVHQKEVQEKMLNQLSTIVTRFSIDGPSLVNMESHVESESYRSCAGRIKMLKDYFNMCGMQNSEGIQKALEVFLHKNELIARLDSINKAIRSPLAPLEDELQARKEVLHRLRYTSIDDTVQMRGLVACEISSAELILTELMHNGEFQALNVEQMVALVSCCVWPHKCQGSRALPKELYTLFTLLQEIARTIATVQLRREVQIDVKTLVNAISPAVMDAVYGWAKGRSFLQIMKLTSVDEGSLVLAIRKVKGALRQLILGAELLGQTQLKVKFQEGIRLIDRGCMNLWSLSIIMGGSLKRIGDR